MATPVRRRVFDVIVGLRSYGAATKEIGNADRREVGSSLTNCVENSH